MRSWKKILTVLALTTLVCGSDSLFAVARVRERRPKKRVAPVVKVVEPAPPPVDPMIELRKRIAELEAENAQLKEGIETLLATADTQVAELERLNGVIGETQKTINELEQFIGPAPLTVMRKKLNDQSKTLYTLLTQNYYALHQVKRHLKHNKRASEYLHCKRLLHTLKLAQNKNRVFIK